MTVYGGFAPGTYAAWTLNLINDIFGSPGIARGFQVTAPGGMLVNVTLDPTNLDAVCFMPNGTFMRIDAQVQFSVPANSSGATRTDAIVAFVDPTGVANPSYSLTYQSNWAGGFGGAANNQLVIALISVANNASNIVSGNITMNSAVASIGTVGGTSSGSMVASDGVGLTVQDNSTTSLLTVILTGITTGVGRGIAIAAQDKSSINHYFYFNTDGSLALGGGQITFDPSPIHGETANSVTITSPAGGSNGTVDNYYNNPTGGFFHFNMQNANVWVDNNGKFSGTSTSASGALHATDSQYVLIGGPGGTAQRIFTGTSTPSNATNGDIWIAA